MYSFEIAQRDESDGGSKSLALLILKILRIPMIPRAGGVIMSHFCAHKIKKKGAKSIEDRGRQAGRQAGREQLVKKFLGKRSEPEEDERRPLHSP